MVTSLKATAVTNSDITLSWAFTADEQNDIRNLRVHHQQMGRQVITYSEMLAGSEQSYTISGLESDQDYRVCVLAYYNGTQRNHQLSSKCIDTSTSTWHMPVSIGSTVGALLALTVIVTIVLLAKCRSKQKPRSRRNSSKCYFSTSHYSSSMDPNMEISDLHPVSEVDESSVTALNESKGSYYYSDGKHGYHSVPSSDKSIREKSSGMSHMQNPEHREDMIKCQDRANNSLADNSVTQCDLNCNKQSEPGEGIKTNQKELDNHRADDSEKNSIANSNTRDLDSGDHKSVPTGNDSGDHHKSVLTSTEIDTFVTILNSAVKQNHDESTQMSSCADNHQKICSATDHKKTSVENKFDGQAETIADQSISIKFTGENITDTTDTTSLVEESGSSSQGNDLAVITTQSADEKCVGNQSGVDRKGVNVSYRGANFKESLLLDMLPESAV